MLKRISFLFIISLAVLLHPTVSWGVMSSSNYTIFSDSIDSGGVLSTSGTYSLQDTAGESSVGSATSSNYEVIGGYQAMDWSVLTINIDTTTLDMGVLTIDQVATSSAVVSVTADASTGYVLSVASISGTALSGVADGSVSPRYEEYGVAVSGPDQAFSDDRSVIVGRVLASSSTPVVSAQTTITFKATMGIASVSGSRSQSVTLTASTNI